jgi:hypothetical protein
MSTVVKAKNAIIHNNLVGNTVFNDTEHEELLGITRNVSKEYLDRNSILIVRREMEIVFITLLEITKRWKKIDDDENDESGFWDYVIKTILGIERGSTNYTKLYKAYTDIIYMVHYKHNIILAAEGNKFYRTLMLHAISPVKSINAFLDLCYNIYKKDLNFNYTINDKTVCELITVRFCEILKKAVGNDKSISIGTNSYSVKVGLRTLAMQDDIQIYFIELLDEALKKINILFYDQNINAQSYFEQLIYNWWQDKQAEIGVDKKGSNRLAPAATKDKIIVRFVRYDDVVYLVIPPIRVDNIKTSTFFLSITAGDSNKPQVAEELFTKRGEFIDTTKQKDINLNELLQDTSNIKIKIEITENQSVLYNKTIEKDFILLGNENEILSNINQSNNYFLYIRGIEKLINKPVAIKQISNNFYNIYPKAGECLSSKGRQVFFQDESSNNINKDTAQIIGSISTGIWIYNNNTYTVFNENITILLPNNININGLELRFDKTKLLLSEINYVSTLNENQNEENYKLFSITEYITKNEPLDIILYSHLEEKIIFKLLIIHIPDLKISLTKNMFYGDDEKSVTIYYNEKKDVLIWNNRQNELNYPLLNGELVIKIPYIKWRSDNKGWRNEPSRHNLWYKDMFHIGSILEFDTSLLIDKIFMEKDEQILNIISINKDGKFDIGDCIYNSGNYIHQYKDLSEFSFSFVVSDNNFKRLFTVSKKEYFYKKPLVVSDNKLFWQAQDSFAGDEKRQFKLEVFNNNEPIYLGELTLNENETIELNEGIYKYKVSSLDNNLFKQNYVTFFEGEIIIGNIEKYIYSNKYIELTSASLSYIETDKNINFWNDFVPKYYIDRIKYIEQENQKYYIGYLYTYNKEGRKIYLDFMENDKKIKEKINPLKIDFLTERTLSIIAGYNINNQEDFLGELIYDFGRNSICNINASIKNKRYRVISSYSYREVKNV